MKSSNNLSDNYLFVHLDEYFMESTIYQWDLLTIESMIKFFGNNIDFSKREIKWVNALKSAFRDLSKQDKGDNLYSSKHKYVLDEGNFNESLKRIESRECLYILAQVYETFESFLIKTVSAFFENNPDYYNKYDLLKKNKEKLAPLDFLIKNLRRKRNNSGFLGIIRKISSFYKTYEVQNIYKIDFRIWGDLVSDIRHSIVHNRQRATEKFLTSLKSNKKQQLFDKFFWIETFNSEKYICTNRLNVGMVIEYLSSFAVLIFRSLSMEAKLNLDNELFDWN